LPWRAVISRNSTTLCDAWICTGVFRAFAASTLACSSASVQVSTWAGASMPKRRPLSCRAAASITLSACAMASRPAASFHSYSTRWPLRVNQRAER